MKVKSEREVAQSCPTLSNLMHCSPPGSSIHGIFQATVLEWGAIVFSSEALDYFNTVSLCLLVSYFAQALTQLPFATTLFAVSMNLFLFVHLFFRFHIQVRS